MLLDETLPYINTPEFRLSSFFPYETYFWFSFFFHWITLRVSTPLKLVLPFALTVTSTLMSSKSESCLTITHPYSTATIPAICRISVVGSSPQIQGYLPLPPQWTTPLWIHALGIPYPFNLGPSVNVLSDRSEMLWFPKLKVIIIHDASA